MELNIQRCRNCATSCLISHTLDSQLTYQEAFSRKRYFQVGYTRQLLDRLLQQRKLTSNHFLALNFIKFLKLFIVFRICHRINCYFSPLGKREIRSSNSRVDRAHFVSVRYDMAKKTGVFSRISCNLYTK